jgi:SAM-dependent methyltransferase
MEDGGHPLSDVLQRSWSGFPREIARRYLKDWGAPSLRSKSLVVELLGQAAGTAASPLQVLDLGCGNGQLLEALRAAGNPCRYTGVDFSDTLLAAAREAHAADRDAAFVKDDIEELASISGPFDWTLFSHVIEMLSCPECALRRAKDLSRQVLIRFFEPPEFDVDTVELREMDVGGDRKVPYLRRKMSRDFYRLILANLGVSRVEIFQADGDKDQLHVLHFAG